MRKTFSCLLIFSALLVPITTSAATPPKDPPGLRLLRKVTVNCPYGRLSDVVQQISEQTDVVIRAGRNKDDWRVRDLPMIVCARDIQLGALLRAIADSTHLLLSSQKVDGVNHYRLWRDLKREKATEAYLQAQKEAEDAKFQYDLDMWQKMKDFTGLEKDTSTPMGFSSSLRDPGVKAISQIISELGPEYRQRIMNRERIKLNLKNAPNSVKEYMKQAFNGVCLGFHETDTKLPSSITSEEDLEESSIEMGYGISTIQPCFDVVIHAEQKGYTKLYDMQQISEKLIKKGYDIAPRPKSPSPPKELALDLRYVPLDYEDPSNGFPEKLKLEAPKDKKRFIYGDVLSALSESTNYAIVAEDFRSQKSWSHAQDAFGKEMRLRELFDEAWISVEFCKWFVDKENKILIGQTDYWVDRHQNLVQRSLLDKIKKKLNTDGVDLLDLKPIAELTKEQIDDWLHNCQGFEGIQNILHDLPQSLWMLFFSLDANEQDKVLSGSPIPLDQFDQEQIDAALLNNTEEIKQYLALPDISDEYRAKKKKLLDSLNSIKSNSQADVRVTKTYYEKTGQLIYSLELNGDRLSGLGAFPKYSSEREKELQKAKTQN